MNEKRFEWEIRLMIIPDALGDSSRALYGCLSNLTKHEVEEVIELMKKHGVVAEGVSCPPYKIYSIHSHKVDEPVVEFGGGE